MRKYIKNDMMAPEEAQTWHYIFLRASAPVSIDGP